MALCSKCSHFKNEYDDFRKEYDDSISESENQERHYCIMYADHIPFDIYYKNGNCPFFLGKEDD